MLQPFLYDLPWRYTGVGLGLGWLSHIRWQQQRESRNVIISYDLGHRYVYIGNGSIRAEPSENASKYYDLGDCSL